MYLFFYYSAPEHSVFEASISEMLAWLGSLATYLSFNRENWETSYSDNTECHSTDDSLKYHTSVQ
jgi:hypothetical protein